jgi:hypothetical protein
LLNWELAPFGAASQCCLDGLPQQSRLSGRGAVDGLDGNAGLCGDERDGGRGVSMLDEGSGGGVDDPPSRLRRLQGGRGRRRADASADQHTRVQPPLDRPLVSVVVSFATVPERPLSLAHAVAQQAGDVAGVHVSTVATQPESPVVRQQLAGTLALR